MWDMNSSYGERSVGKEAKGMELWEGSAGKEEVMTGRAGGGKADLISFSQA